MHWDILGAKLGVHRIGIGRKYVSIPGCPFMTRVIGLWMDVRRNGFEHEHDPVATEHGPEIPVFISAFMEHIERQSGLVELQCLCQIINYKKWRDVV
jgi:hypothetical protein